MFVVSQGTRFSIVFNHVRFPDTPTLAAAGPELGVALVPLPIPGQKVRDFADLLATSTIEDGALHLDLTYDARRFDRSTIEDMFSGLPALLESIVREPTASLTVHLGRLPVLLRPVRAQPE